MKALIGLVLYVLVNEARTSEMGSPLKTAQCRAYCVHMFTHNVTNGGHTEKCDMGSECQKCWDFCRYLSNPRASCKDYPYCGTSCEPACRFMDSQKRTQKVPVLVRRGEEVLETEGNIATWPASEPGSPNVFLVMRKSHNGWRQITQTLKNFARIPSGGMVRVLVVGKDGLVTIYGPAVEPTDYNFERGWHLREVSVIHQEAVVIAEVAWDSVYPGARYLVTWEVAGGGLRGNLISSSTCVALSLWPDTFFHVQVELMSPEASADKKLKEIFYSRIAQKKSKELIIDTRKSANMEVLMDYDDADENEIYEMNEGKYDEIVLNEVQYLLYQKIQNDLIDYIELFLALFFALAFLIILMCLKLRPKVKKLDEFNTKITDASVSYIIVACNNELQDNRKTNSKS